MKVFLSHASSDKPTVRSIAAALEDGGLEVWLDEADVRVGESIPEAVATGLAESDVLLLALSHEALSSRWVKREMNAFIVIAMSTGKPILPCRLDNAEPPTLLADIKYADFRGSLSLGLNALMGAVGVMEEATLMREAQRIASEVGVALTEDERRNCFDTWVKGDGMKVNIFVHISKYYDKRVITLLEKRRLIKDVGTSDMNWVSTTLGTRVFSLWATEIGLL